MDICVSSNFERYLYHLCGDDSSILSSWMTTFESTGKLTIDGALLQQAQSDFLSARADTEKTLETIQTYYNDHEYMLCPHTAVGVNSIHQLDMTNQDTVCLATAHFAKFPAACQRVIDPLPEAPEQLKILKDMDIRRYYCKNDVDAIQGFMHARLDERK